VQILQPWVDTWLVTDSTDRKSKRITAPGFEARCGVVGVQPGDGLQALVPLLDGTRDRPALLASGALKLDAEGLDAALEELAQAALLMAV